MVKTSIPYPRAAVAVTLQSKSIPSSMSQDGSGGSKINHYLLIQRANPPDQGKWSLPGGKINLGETTMDAAQRELAEETQLAAQDCIWHPHPFMTTDAIFYDQGSVQEENEQSAISPSSSLPQKDSQNLAFHYVIAQCFGQAPDGLPSLVPSDDAMDARWWTLAEMKGELVPENFISEQVMGVIQRAEELYEKGALL